MPPRSSAPHVPGAESGGRPAAPYHRRVPLRAPSRLRRSRDGRTTPDRAEPGRHPRGWWSSSPAWPWPACTSPVVPGSAHGTVAYVATLAGRADPGDDLAAVDTATATVLPPVAVGSLPSAMAATPDGHDLLVTAKGVNQLVEVSTRPGRWSTGSAVGLEPRRRGRVTPTGPWRWWPTSVTTP